MKDLSKNKLKNKEDNPILTTRKSSLPTDNNLLNSPKIRFSSLPSTPKSTSPRSSKFNFNTFSPQLENFEEVGEILDNFLTKGQSSSDKIFDKLLTEKEKLITEQEREIKRLEADKKAWLEEKQELEQTQLKQSSLLKKQSQELIRLNHLEQELKQSNEDVYQTDLKNKELNKLLVHEKATSRRLESELERETAENYHLRTNYEQTKNDLLEKVDELTHLKRLEKQEKEQWAKVFSEQEQKYELEKNKREKRFSQEMNNLRTFQLTADLPVRFKGGHKRNLSQPLLNSISLPTSQDNSPRNSIYKEEVKSPSLFQELSPKNFFNQPYTSSPLTEINNPIDDAVEELLAEVDNLKVSENNQEQQNLLTENEILKQNQQELEKAWKLLADERIENERKLKEFNEQKLNWENKEEKLMEELNEMKYKLAQAVANQERTEKSEKKLKYQLKEKQTQREQDWEKFAQETQELDNNLQNSQNLFGQLQAQIEALNHQTKIRKIN